MKKLVLSALAVILATITPAFAEGEIGTATLTVDGTASLVSGSEYSRTTLAENVPCFSQEEQPEFLVETSTWWSPEGFTTGPHHAHEVRQLEGDGYIVQQQRQRLFGNTLYCTQTVIYETTE